MLQRIPYVTVGIRVEGIQVHAERSREENGVLGQDGDLGSELVKAKLGHVLVINNYGTTRWFNYAEQSQGQGRLACTCPANNANLQKMSHIITKWTDVK